MVSVPRKKQPEQVRLKLLQATAEIAAERGLEFVTTAEVAKRAGVTSGALFHHFPSKKHLIDEMILNFTKDLEALIEEAVKRDPEPRGRFTRAYLVTSCACDHTSDDCKLLGAITTAMNRDADLAELWVGWMERQMEKYGGEDDPVLAAIIRYAADGLWMESFAVPCANPETRRAAIQKLMEWTRQL